MGSYELLVWLIRTSGTAEHSPPARHHGDVAACRAAPPSASTAATATEFPRRGERDTPDQERQPAAQAAGPGISASAQAGNPLSERKLAQMFGHTSRRWARARIAEARRALSSGLTEDPAITVGVQSQ